MALVDSRTRDLEWSLKLYHPRGLAGYQQSITEAPEEGLSIGRVEASERAPRLTQFDVGTSGYSVIARRPSRKTL